MKEIIHAAREANNWASLVAVVDGNNYAEIAGEAADIAAQIMDDAQHGEAALVDAANAVNTVAEEYHKVVGVALEAGQVKVALRAHRAGDAYRKVWALIVAIR